MTDTTAAFVAPFDRRFVRPGDPRRVVRAIGKNAVMGFGAAAAVGLLVVIVTTAAAWIVNTTLTGNSFVHTRPAMGPGTLALASLQPVLTRVADGTFESRWAQASARGVPVLRPDDRTQVATLAPAAVPLPPKRAVIQAQAIPLPRPHPAQLEIARAPAVEPTPQVVAELPPPVSVPEKRIAPMPVPEKRVAPVQEAHNKSPALLDSRTAVYDISARAVYMPNGEKLEAHSGLYDKMDDPRYVDVRMRGPTPPNVYDLTLREKLFHGVRAIRLNPVDEDKMFGRAGMLAHTYMLGPNGQSNGCVSFKNYDKFLQAFLRGEVDRLVVVPKGGTQIAARARRGGDRRYAAADTTDTWRERAR